MNLKVFEQNGELYTESRNVADLIGKRHSDLLRDIENYKTIIDQNAELRSEDFFVESSYKSGTGKSYKSFLLGKKGCDIVANKMTGEKGILFSATYVNQFHEMQNHINSSQTFEVIEDPIKLLELNLKAIKQSNERIENVESDVKYLKDEIRLDTGEYNYLTKQVNRTVMSTISSFGLAQTREVKNELFRDINRGLNEVCEVKTRTQLKQKHFDQAVNYIQAWIPSTATKMKVQQLSMELDQAE